MTALRAIWAALVAIPAWIWAPLLALAIGVGCHERTGRQAAEIDVQRAIAELATSEAAQARDRALAAESAAEEAAQTVTAQQGHARRQKEVIDETEPRMRAAQAQIDAARADAGRARDDAGRLRRALAARVAESASATTRSDAAAGECVRAAGELGGLLATGEELAAEGHGLAGEGERLGRWFDAALERAEGVIRNDREVTNGGPHKWTDPQ